MDDMKYVTYPVANPWPLEVGAPLIDDRVTFRVNECGAVVTYIDGVEYLPFHARTMKVPAHFSKAQIRAACLADYRQHQESLRVTEVEGGSQS